MGSRRRTRSGSRFTPVLAVLAIACLPGCSAFEREWEAQRADAGTGLEGRWSGTWLSDANGHNGGLRCIVSEDEAGVLQAWYHATYGPFFTFEYTVPMTVRRDGEAYLFSAGADLGWLAGGWYDYEGQVVGDEFTSSYECKRDHGTFQMTRVGEEAEFAR